MGAFQTQPNGWSCGVLSIQNAIRALGGEAEYADIKRLSGANSKEGTSCKGVLKALEGLGYLGVPYRTNNHDNGWKFVRKWATKTPMILLVDNHTHYFVLSGMVGDKVIAIDSGADVSCNEMGTFVYSKQELLARWINRGSCYAIRVSKA